MNNLLRRASASYQSSADRIIIAYALNVTQFLPPSDWALRLIPCGNSVDMVAEAAGAFFKAGFTDLALVQIGGTEPEQDRFLAAAPELITALKETAG